MRIRRKKWLFISLGVVSAVAILLVAGLWYAKGKIYDRLVGAGFAEHADVSIHLIDGVVIRELQPARPFRLGPSATQISVDQVKIPVNPLSVLTGASPVRGKISVDGIRLRIERSLDTKGSEQNKTGRDSFRNKLLRMIKRLCPEGCTLDVNDVQLLSAELESIVPNLPAANGIVYLSPDGSVEAFLENEEGMEFEARVSLSAPKRTFTAQIRNPPRLYIPEPVGQQNLEKLDRMSLIPRSIREEFRNRKLKNIDSRVGAVTISAKHGIWLHDVKLWVSDQVGNRVTTKIEALRLDQSDWPLCKGLPACITDINRTEIIIERAGRPLGRLGTQTVRFCGPRCLELTGLSWISDARDLLRSLTFNALQAKWPTDEPAIWLASGGRGTFRIPQSAVTAAQTTLSEAPEAPPDPKKKTSKKRRRRKRSSGPDFAVRSRARLSSADALWNQSVGQLFSKIRRIRSLSEHIPRRLEVDNAHLFLELENEDAPSKLHVYEFGINDIDDKTVHVSGFGSADLQGFVAKVQMLRSGLTANDKAQESPKRSLWLGKTPITLSGSGNITDDGDVTAVFMGELPDVFARHKMLAPDEVHSTPIGFSGTLHRVSTPDRSQWKLEGVHLSSQDGAFAVLQAGLELGPSPKKSGIGFRLDFPYQDCKSLHRSIPEGMVPRLKDVVLKGNASIVLNGHMRFKSTQTLDFWAEGNFDDCVPLHMGKQYALGKLKDPNAVFLVDDPKLPKPVKVGQGTGSWVGFHQIPSYVWGAALATEDMGFWGHQGFKENFIRKALILNLDRGRYAYGGSTITQQLVKNLFLSREKNLSRKLEEAYLVWSVERKIEKTRILELYMNCIEYGPGVYGIRKAAKAYWGRPVADINPVEATFLMFLKPSPTHGYYTWRKRRILERFRTRLETVQRRLLESGWIGEDLAVTMIAEILYDRAQPVASFLPPKHFKRASRKKKNAKKNKAPKGQSKKL